MSRLPEITYRELLALLRTCSTDLRGEGSSQIVGRSRNGKPFAVHQYPSQKVHPAKLSKVLSYAEITRDDSICGIMAKGNDEMELLVTVESTEEGFLAYSDEFRAVASGSTEEEAVANLRGVLLEMLQAYEPELREALARRRVRKLEIAA